MVKSEQLCFRGLVGDWDALGREGGNGTVRGAAGFGLVLYRGRFRLSGLVRVSRCQPQLG